MQHDESLSESPAKPSGPPSDGASESSRKLGLGYLLGFAGRKRWLLSVGCALSAVAMLLTFGPYICIWLVARDLIAVAPDWTQRTWRFTGGSRSSWPLRASCCTS